jgi:hypothetical protein
MSIQTFQALAPASTSKNEFFAPNVILPEFILKGARGRKIFRTYWRTRRLQTAIPICLSLMITSRPLPAMAVIAPRWRRRNHQRRLSPCARKPH